MHYYKRNIGDYAKKAARLSMLQHGAYTLLLDACYDRERFPTKDEALDWTWASTEAEVAAVEFVLSRFFVLEGGRYIQTRIAEELAAFEVKSKKNKDIALAREEQKRTKRARVEQDRARDDQDRAPTYKPLTTNQEPKEKTPAGVSPEVWESFLTHRRAKKAPVTPTALKTIEREATKAGLSLQAVLEMICARGWTGFSADWVSAKTEPARKAL